MKVAAENQGFILHPSGKVFVPWGHNYASADILERLAKDPQRVEREFAEMKATGTTVARIHPELPRILTGPKEVDAKGIDSLKQLLKIAEKSGVHLKITGLANYKIRDRVAWYEKMQEQHRWRTQAFFWETIARTCVDSPAVFAYDRVNEPGAVGKQEDGWYMGWMGEVEFCQRLSLIPGERSGDDVFRERTFDWGKPIVIGETFPLSCGPDEERDLLLKSREFAHGWIGHWPDKSPAELAKLKKTGKASIQNAIWLSWVEIFQELGPQMTTSK